MRSYQPSGRSSSRPEEDARHDGKMLRMMKEQKRKALETDEDEDL